MSIREITSEDRNKALGYLDAKMDSRMLTHLNSCVHCGLCAESCLYYIATKDDRFMPARKVDLVASVYKRYKTFSGKTFPRLSGARELDQETVEEMIDLLYGACTMCGRCTTHCSIGVDISFLVSTGRAMLAKMDLVPKTLQSTVDAALNSGNNMSIPTTELVDTLDWLQEDLQMEVEDDTAIIPMDQKGKKYMYTLNPREPKFFPMSISAMAKVFHVARESWTLSTKIYDVTNYAYYSGDKEHARELTQRMYEEMQKLEAEQLVLAECGHGSRAIRWEGPNYIEKEYPFHVLTSVELLAQYIREGRIKTDPSLNTEKVTLHDPCNLARNGGIVQEQRYILKHCVSDFVEMNPHGLESFCCGGGGGQLSMSEYNDRRMAIGEIKAEQIRATGAQIVVTPCHNCVDQLLQLNQTFKLNVKIRTMAEIVADAIVIGE